MIEQQARVLDVRGDLAEVRLGGASGCARCDAGKGCGAGIFGRLLRRKPVSVMLSNTVSARPGQAVIVGIPEALFLNLVFRFYLFPLLTGVVGAAIGHYVAVAAQLGPSGTDAATLLAGLAAGLAVIFASGRAAREFPELSIVHLLRIAAYEESVN